MDEKKDQPEKVTPKPPKKPRDLKAATHILKK
uniref:Uncharacterized protein n=1 Tax=Ciona savignyi TaxID=51511 RepID=H2ZFL8_CIOSA